MRITLINKVMCIYAFRGNPLSNTTCLTLQVMFIKCIKHDFWGWGLSVWPLAQVLERSDFRRETYNE